MPLGTVPFQIAGRGLYRGESVMYFFVRFFNQLSNLGDYHMGGIWFLVWLCIVFRLFDRFVSPRSKREIRHCPYLYTFGEQLHRQGGKIIEVNLVKHSGWK